MSLKTQLENHKQSFLQKADSKVIKAYDAGVDAVRKSGILENALKKGDKAKDFLLKNALYEPAQLSEYLSRGPVVLIWYRGGWCPYCNLELKAFQDVLPEIKALGANLLALTPELPDKSLSTKEKHSLEFEVLSDVGNRIAWDYGLVFKLPEDVAEIYAKNFSLQEYNGDSSNELPIAATYVIDKKGIIQYAFLDAEYRNRAEPEEIIKVLKRL
ncbi:peroxiredoxin-like family protein [Flexithrix dorotheae]|uniref:peroxiredoxin-like family protein n=1 Tax=Flexithrix dorotheae TaxID=70993 RepID=UPI00037F2B73|nr:peroxiredoxin-like family protein [Flexithrix dorotheae]